MKKVFSFRLDNDLISRIDKIAKNLKINRNGLVSIAIEEFARKHLKK